MPTPNPADSARLCTDCMGAGVDADGATCRRCEGRGELSRSVAELALLIILFLGGSGFLAVAILWFFNAL